MSELLSVKDVSDLLHVTPQTIWGYIRSGQLQASFIGNKYQIKQEWLDAFVEQGAPGKKGRVTREPL